MKYLSHTFNKFEKRTGLISSVLLVLILNIYSSAVVGDGKFYRVEFNIEPSNEVSGSFTRTAFAWICYDGETGKKIKCGVHYEHMGQTQGEVEADCIFDASGLVVPNTCSNGGHSHGNPVRPLVFNDEDIEYSQDSNPSPLIVDGNTFATPNLPPFQDPHIIHKQTQVGGVYSWETTATAPPGWRWPEGIRFTLGTVKAVGLTNLHVKNLRQLPEPVLGDDYIRVRGGPSGAGTDPFHTDSVSYAGTPKSVHVIPLIASTYFIYSERKLSVNDMSLPKGGVFEARDNWSETSFDWKAPHRTHRDGFDVDINKGGLKCLDDPELRQAVDQLLDPPQQSGRTTALLCESGGRKHIDITTFADTNEDI